MPEVIILEDDLFCQDYIKRMLPDGLSYEIAETSEGLRALLAKNLDTTIFILDDKVPATAGEKATYQFLSNVQTILEANPNAQVWYTGSAPGAKEYGFCKQKGIRMIIKTNIREIFRES